MAEIDAYLALAADLADAAGAAIRPYFRVPLQVEDKADLSPVTAADRGAEAAMRRLIAARFPDHGIIGEEFGREREDAEFVWVLIALAQNGRPIIGIIDQPISRERWIGAAGRETTHNGGAVHCRACPGMAAATVFATSPDMFKGANAPAFARAAAAAKLVRYGADCYAAVLLALGCIDMVIEADLKPYDYSALIAVVEGAGGIATDWRGAPLDLHSDGRVIFAGDRRSHREALALLVG